MQFRRFRTLMALPLALALAVGACGDDDDPTGTSAVAGTYVLTSANGAPLPMIDSGTGPNDPDRSEITAITLVLHANGNVSGTLAWREFSNNVVVDSGTETLTGTYTVSGSTITLNMAGEDPQTATLSGNTLTLNSFGDILVFTRQ